MPDDPKLSRRDFAKLAGAMAILPGTLKSPVTSLDPRPSTLDPAWPGYSRAFVLDMLATAGPFNVSDMFGKLLTAEMVENARGSGITAINVTVSGSRTGLAAYESTVRAIAFWERELDAHPDVFLRIRTAADLRRAKESQRVGIILGFQDATMLDDDTTRLETFRALGVRVVQLTYNVRNLLGDGCLEPANGGLSAFGRECVARMNDLGMLVDLSHCGRQTTRDGITVSRKPIGITHTGCSAIADVPRNKPDEILREMAQKGGVVGIYLMPFLRKQGQPMAADFMQHLEHALKICGEDHVGIGSDNSITPLDITAEFRRTHEATINERRRRGISAPGEEPDVFTYVPDINSPRRMEIIADLMAKAGHPSARIEKVIGGNWVRLLGEVWR